MELPARLVTKFQQLGCAKPENAGPPAVRGAFTEKNITDWALLCQKGRAETLIVFGTGSQAPSWEIWKTFDGDGVALVGRRIEPVERRFIVEHCQPNDGAALPPIDHEGILDGFDGSIVHYYYRGHWLHLTTKK
jgi:hypothetical protein